MRAEPMLIAERVARTGSLEAYMFGLDTAWKVVEKVMALAREYPPIHCIHVPALTYPLPREYREKLGEDVSRLRMQFMGLQNFSPVGRSIRIKLQEPTLHTPVVTGSRLGIAPEWEFNQEQQEILVKRLDPMEAVYVTLYPDASQDRDVKSPTVFVDGALLSKPMRWHGEVRKYPGMTLLPLATVAMLAFSGFQFMRMEQKFAETDQIHQAFASGFGGRAKVCGSYMVHPKEHPVNWSQELSGSPFPLGEILQINGAKSLEELQTKDSVVLCK